MQPVYREVHYRTRGFLTSQNYHVMFEAAPHLHPNSNDLPLGFKSPANRTATKRAGAGAGAYNGFTRSLDVVATGKMMRFSTRSNASTLSPSCARRSPSLGSEALYQSCSFGPTQAQAPPQSSGVGTMGGKPVLCAGSCGGAVGAREGAAFGH